MTARPIDFRVSIYNVKTNSSDIRPFGIPQGTPLVDALERAGLKVVPPTLKNQATPLYVKLTPRGISDII